MIGPAPPVAAPLAPPFDDTHDTPNEVMELPPLFAGAVNATDKDAFLLTAVAPKGESGTVTAGAAAFDAAEDPPVPAAFVALTAQVYVFALVSPLTMMGRAAPIVKPLSPPFDDTHAAV